MPKKQISIKEVTAAQEELKTIADSEGWTPGEIEWGLDYLHNVAHNVDPHAHAGDVSVLQYATIWSLIKKHYDLEPIP
jgi:hypothetical protein